MNRIHHKAFASSAAVLLGAALLLSGCASGDEDSPAAPGTAATTAPAETSAAASSPAASTADLMTGESSLGTIVVDGEGMSLYYFTKDTKDTKVSACTGGCLEAWPIATTTNDTPVVEGVTGEVGTIDSPDGKKHLTLNGMPLYYWAKDTKPGDVTGQGVNDVWYVVTPAGEMIK
jgi:predicted lipoprotein with Yx(FWY)xxD motif